MENKRQTFSPVLSELAKDSVGGCKAGVGSGEGMPSDLHHGGILCFLPRFLKTLKDPVLGLPGPAKAAERALALRRLL